MTDEELVRAVSAHIAVLRMELAEARAENHRLRSELSRSQRAVSVVLFLERQAGPDVAATLRDTYASEPPGTIARATDNPGSEWRKDSAGWQRISGEDEA